MSKTKNTTPAKDQTKSSEPRSIQLTQQGLDDLKAELANLQDVKIPTIIKRVAEARTHGDLSENAEYQNAREEQLLLEARLAEVEEIIAKATVVKKTTSSTRVGMGTVVKLSSKSAKGKTFTYTIVGEFQANPLEGKVSSDSPIGRSLLGKKKGDTVVVKAPKGETTFTIEEIK